jgi:flagellar basal-body rod protein FlgB
MALQIAKGFNILEQSLFYRKIRQDLIASNIANADTPYYKSRDIRFEGVLQKEIEKEFSNAPEKKLKLAITNPLDLEPKDIDDDKPVIFFRDGFLERNDGNDVDIDVETTEMAKNNIAYKATIAAIRKEIQIFGLAIDSSKNI